MRPLWSRIVAPLASALASIAWSTVASAADPPSLDWDTPVTCMRGPTGAEIRVQCEEPGKWGGSVRRCLVAPNQMRNEGGDLRDVQSCVTNHDRGAYEDMVKSGAQIVPAVAEAPPGYARAESGRVYQVKFDLLNRLYLGFSWTPTFLSGDSAPSGFPWGRVQAETGIHVSALSPRGRSRHDMRLLEGTAAFSDLEVNGLLFSYDYQHLHRRPAFWLTTFFGDPQVHGVPMPLGWGFRMINVHDRPPAARQELDVEFTEVHLAWNPWQSDDLYSHLRLEAGGNYGKLWQQRKQIADGLDTGYWYLGFSGAVRSRFSLGEGGLHYIFLDVAYTRPTFVEDPFKGESVDRLSGTMAYEAIFLAINDQPLSLRITASGSSREDLATGVQTVEVAATAGLRFSFWAPPRRFEPLPDFEQ